MDEGWVLCVRQDFQKLAELFVEKARRHLKGEDIDSEVLSPKAGGRKQSMKRFRNMRHIGSTAVYDLIIDRFLKNAIPLPPCYSLPIVYIGHPRFLQNIHLFMLLKPLMKCWNTKILVK